MTRPAISLGGGGGRWSSLQWSWYLYSISNWPQSTLTCEPSCSLCCGNTCRRCRRSGGWTCGTARGWSGCTAWRTTWRTTGSRRSRPLPGSEESEDQNPGNIFRERDNVTFKDFFLLPVFFSYISTLRLTANILSSKFVVQSLSDLLALELILKMSDIGELDWTSLVCWKRGER